MPRENFVGTGSGSSGGSVRTTLGQASGGAIARPFRGPFPSQPTATLAAAAMSQHIDRRVLRVPCGTETDYSEIDAAGKSRRDVCPGRAVPSRRKALPAWRFASIDLGRFPP